MSRSSLAACLAYDSVALTAIPTRPAAINAVAAVTLEDVMTEKYRAMFAMESESWVDLRRHGYQYPAYLAIPVSGTTGNPVATQFIQRFLYPQDELDKNASNVPTGLDEFSKLIFAQ